MCHYKACIIPKVFPEYFLKHCNCINSTLLLSPSLSIDNYREEFDKIGLILNSLYHFLDMLYILLLVLVQTRGVYDPVLIGPGHDGPLQNCHFNRCRACLFPRAYGEGLLVRIVRYVLLVVSQCEHARE
jgi:hypothetical protein